MNEYKDGVQLLSAKTLGRQLSVSKGQVFRLHACGKIPRALRIGGSVRWVASEIEAWLSEGAPDLKTWEALKDAGQSKGAGQ